MDVAEREKLTAEIVEAIKVALAPYLATDLTHCVCVLEAASYATGALMLDVLNGYQDAPGLVCATLRAEANGLRQQIAHHVAQCGHPDCTLEAHAGEAVDVLEELAGLAVDEPEVAAEDLH